MDFLTDPNPAAMTRYLALFPDPPAWLTETPVYSMEKLASLTETQFADPVAREYPIDSRVSTLLGCVHHAYQSPAGPGHSTIAASLSKAASFWGISKDVEAALAFLDGQKKQAAAPSVRTAFAYTCPDEDGSFVGYWPIDNYGSLLKSAFALARHVQQRDVPETILRKAAATLVECSAQVGVHRDQIPFFVLEKGLPRVPNFEKAASLVEMRARAGVGEEALEIYRRLVKTAQENPDAIDECCELMEDLDQQLKIAYTVMQPSPAEIFFGGSRLDDIQQALDREIVLRNSAVIPLEIFKHATGSIPLDTLFREATASNIKKAAALSDARECSVVLSSLTDDEQNRLTLAVADAI
ncbi:hypothetical protein EB061_09870 [bacterium]|nr:hypothetical protein [bacterium]